VRAAVLAMHDVMDVEIPGRPPATVR
jgi:hypothetical protein